MASPKKTSRRAERIIAFKVLYGLCFSPVTSYESLEESFNSLPDKPEDVRSDFAWQLVLGTWKHQDDLDKTIMSFSQNWRIERMGKVELTLLRLAMFELLYRQDIPPRVIMNEAIELSKQFGDDKSRGCVNGILDTTSKSIESGSLVRQAFFTEQDS